MRPSWLVLALLLPVGNAFGACTVSMPSLSFGVYDALSSAPVTTSGNAVINCNDNPPPTVTVQLGPSTVSGGFFPRRMRAAAGADLLDYNFYADASATQVFGDGTGGTAIRSMKVNKNQPWSVTFYGRIAPNQDVAPGGYADTLTITINF
ncbi:MAG TPA: spore coat U domain-containing protein [Burkholderiales bacterium]|nr:spore coat U domain-containing protein [Burkholderiales bacterium]